MEKHNPVIAVKLGEPRTYTEYATELEASKATGVPPKTVQSICNCNAISCQGYTFFWANTLAGAMAWDVIRRKDTH